MYVTLALLLAPFVALFIIITYSELRASEWWYRFRVRRNNHLHRWHEARMERLDKAYYAMLLKMHQPSKPAQPRRNQSCSTSKPQ
jgi:hypothetical protein